MAIIGLKWTQLKFIATENGRNLPFTHYIENNHYFIIISDGSQSYRASIRIDDPSVDDQLDWETNFLSKSNTLPLDIKGGTSLLQKPHDEVVVTYRMSAPGNGEIDQVVTKLNTVIQETLTFAYGAGNKLINIIRT